MMTVATSIEVSFLLTTGDAPYFRVGDPVRGVVGGATYRVAGPIWIDITESVVSASVKRGRNRELDRFSAGQLSVVLNNETRLFDPLNDSSPYVGNIIPRRAIRLITGGVAQFTGVIEDWDFDYSTSGESKASIKAADAFTLFAQQSLTAGTATPQTTGERVNAVLSQPTVAWPLTDRNIEAGAQTVGADVFDGGVLDYLIQVEASEQGQLFVGKNGFVNFINGNKTITSAGVVASFSDDGSGVPYSAASVNYGTDLLFNQVESTSPAGTAVANNTVSQDKYGIASTSVDTLLNTFTATENIAQFWVNKYAEPEYRFESIVVVLDGLDGSQLVDVLAIELGDIIDITFTPNQIGSAISRFGQVISINHDVKPGSHQVTFGVGSLQYSFLVLDDAGFGILDVNALGF
jgi:hypothetical protein